MKADQLKVSVSGIEIPYSRSPVEESWEEAVRYYGFTPGLPKNVYLTDEDIPEDTGEIEEPLDSCPYVIERCVRMGLALSRYQRDFLCEMAIPNITKHIDDPRAFFEIIDFDGIGSYISLLFEQGKLFFAEGDRQYETKKPTPTSIILAENVPSLNGMSREEQIKVINARVEQGELNHLELFKMFMDRLKTV
jgi:hypothetical protein